jgi:hypothetical protein
MVRSALFLFCLTGLAEAQPGVSAAPIHFYMKWDVHNSAVRIRPQADSGMAWTLLHAQRFRLDTFQVVDAIYWPLRVQNPAAWTVEVSVPEHQQRFARGNRIGAAFAVISAVGIIRNAMTCENRSGNGPGCQTVVILIPPAAAAGLALGHVVSRALPTREWHSVSGR